MTLSELCRTLNAKGRHPKWRAKCPAHGSRALTLAIYADKDGIGLHCHAGCEKDDVLTAMGLTWKDLKADKEWLSPEAFKAMKKKEREAEIAAETAKRELGIWHRKVNRWEEASASAFATMIAHGRTPEALHAADLWHQALSVARMYRERLWTLQRATGVRRNKLPEVDCYLCKNLPTTAIESRV